MSKPQKIDIFEVQTWNGGMNRRDPINALAQNEVFHLSGYLCYPNSIRACGKETAGVTLNFTLRGLFNWNNASFSERVIATCDTRIFSVDSAFSSTNITGAVAVTDGRFSGVAFNQYLFLCNGVDNVIKVSQALATSNPGFTGPGAGDLVFNQVWTYKGRLYFVERNSNTYWYGGLGFITGATTSVPLDSFFQMPGKLLFGCEWTMNQGASSESFCVLVSTFGEILIYSGDYPNAPNWYLVGRTKIETPLDRRSYCKIGNDVAVYTKAGIVLLSEAFAKASNPSTLFTITDKISRVFERGWYPTTDTEANIISDRESPFIYARAGSDGGNTITNGVFAQNLQTGAWSYLPISSGGTNFITCMCHAFGYLVLGYSASGQINYIPKTSVLGMARTVISEWYDFGNKLVKQIKAVRLVTANMNESLSSSTSYKLTINSDYFNLNDTSGANENKVSQTLSATTSSGSDTILVTEFDNVGIIGKRFRFQISATDGGIDEIYKLEIDFENGGVL